MARGRSDNQTPAMRAPDLAADPVSFRTWWKELSDHDRLAYEWPQALDYADLSHLDLSGCDLSERSLYGANLNATKVDNTNFINSDLRHTQVVGSNLHEAKLHFAQTDWENAMSLDNARMPGLDGIFNERENTFLTATGILLENVHERTNECDIYGCAIHNPSNHALRHMPVHWNWPKKMFMRKCEHGDSHPDPDNLAWWQRNNIHEYVYKAEHHCDGCCNQ